MYPFRKAGGIQILRCQGIAVNYYGCTLGALALNPSGFCNVGGKFVLKSSGVMMRTSKKCLFLSMAMIIGCATPSVRTIDNTYLGKEPIVADHTCHDIDQIPKHWLEVAKANFGISYGHTSHGSQIISGMQALEQKDDFFSFSSNPGKNHLTIFDSEPRGDLGNPDRKTWYLQDERFVGSWLGRYKHHTVVLVWAGIKCDPRRY